MHRRFEHATAIVVSKRFPIKSKSTHFGPYLEFLDATTDPMVLTTS